MSLFHQPALFETLNTFNVTTDGSCEEIVEKTQKEWLRPQNQERYELSEKWTTVPKEKAFLLFERLGMVDSVYPKNNEYEIALIFGSTLPFVQKALTFLSREWMNHDLRFLKLVFLGGERPLFPFEKCGTATNEIEMLHFVFENTKLPWSVPTTFINAAAKNGSPRATTEDTIIEWLSTNPPPESLLFVSNQPFVQRQGLLARRLVPKEFEVETIGEGFSFEEFKMRQNGTTILLDELARSLYEEGKIERCSLEFPQ